MGSGLDADRAVERADEVRLGDDAEQTLLAVDDRDVVVSALGEQAHQLEHRLIFAGGANRMRHHLRHHAVGPAVPAALEEARSRRRRR